ncbi:MAG: DNA polymerase III subunit delta' [Chloroflexota bacterium]|nr:MAG: DNA polymerase III subunit delta' [Chloroflexota bacterium]
MWQTIGQPEALALIEHSLKTGNLAHAYLFVGAPHIGKTTLALDLARAVNCQGNQPPCGECQSCRRITDGKHTDITIISLNPGKDSGETKSRVEISIDDIRELQHNASLPPFEGKCKVFIIDGAEYLSTEAANCLLKTIEEPPPQVMILLLTANESRLLPTVVSRCQRIELKPLVSDEIEKILTESNGVDGDRAKLLARLSQGCLGWALIISADDTYLVQRNQRLTEMSSLLTAGWEERFSYTAKLGNERKSAEEMIKLWLAWWHDVMLTKCDCKHAIANVDHTPTLEKWAQALSLLEIRNFINSLHKSLSQIAMNANLRLVFEILMLDMPKKEVKQGQKISSEPVVV